MSPEGLVLHADADHFEFVLRNLLSNAVKFSYEGGQIDIKAQLPLAPKELIFVVKD